MNDLPLDVQLAIVNAGLSGEVVRLGVVCAHCLGAWLALRVLMAGWDLMSRELRRHLAFFLLYALAFVAYAAFKPRISWPTGITGGKAEFDEDVWSYLTLHWTKRPSYPDDATLTLYAVEKTGDRLRYRVGEMQAGACSNTFAAAQFPSCYTNYDFVVESDWDPGEVRIDDLRAVASMTELAVTCRWTVPTNLVGEAGIVQFRRIDWDPDAWQILDTVTLERTNEYRTVGNFISQGIDRQFRVVVPDWFGGKAKMVKMMDDNALKGQVRFKGWLDGAKAARKRRRESEERVAARKFVERAKDRLRVRPEARLPTPYPGRKERAR